jgi:hypothetical protein
MINIKTMMQLSCSAVTLLGVLAGCATPPERQASYRAAPPPPVQPPAPPQQVYFYASKGQTPDQVDRDRFECHEWAVKQSGFDPSLPQSNVSYRPRQYRDLAPARDTANGAVAGAVVGAVAAGPRNSGEGAVIGAVAGAIIGSTADAQRQAAIQQANDAQAARAQQVASSAYARQDGYQRALAACGTARGYDVR